MDSNKKLVTVLWPKKRIVHQTFGKRQLTVALKTGACTLYLLCYIFFLTFLTSTGVSSPHKLVIVIASITSFANAVISIRVCNVNHIKLIVFQDLRWAVLCVFWNNKYKANKTTRAGPNNSDWFPRMHKSHTKWRYNLLFIVIIR